MSMKSRTGFLMPSHPLTNFDIQRYYQDEPRFNGVYSRDNLPNKLQYEVYVTNLDEYVDVGTHLIYLYVNDNNGTYSEIEYIPKEIKKFIGNNNITTNIFRMQAYNSVMYGYFCSGFIDFMLKGKSLTDFTNLLLSINFKHNDKIILH